jgi:hypothetical protein
MSTPGDPFIRMLFKICHMVTDDLPGVPENDDRRILTQKIENFVSEVREDSAAVENWEMNKASLIYGGDYDVEIWSAELPSLAYSDPYNSPTFENYPATEQLKQFVTSQFEHTLSDDELLRVLRDALGVGFEQQDPDTSQARNNLLNYLNGHAEGTLLVPLSGLNAGKGGVLMENVRIYSELQSFQSLRKYRFVNAMKGQYPAHSLAEINLKYDPDSPPQPLNSSIIDIIEKLFRLYTGCLV